MTRTKKILILIFTSAVIGAVAGEVYAQERLRQLMIDKLTNSQKLLEGIALGKFDKIEKHANELIRISKTAEWLANKKPRYEMFSNDFVRAAETIAKKAKEKNLDGVTLAYFDLTMSCVRCHQYVREIQDARGPGERDLFANGFTHKAHSPPVQ
jgi:gamma-glutamylcysteine synthetase